MGPSNANFVIASATSHDAASASILSFAAIFSLLAISVTTADICTCQPVVQDRKFQRQHKGEFQGIPPTGKKLSLDEMGFITIIDGKITEGWISADTMRLMQQIGALPPPSSGNTGSSNTARS
jgi:hypothetical protein